MGKRGQQHRRRWQQAAVGTDAADAQSSGQPPSPAPQQRPIPWNLTFDLRERETLWTDENKVELHISFACPCFPWVLTVEFHQHRED